METAFIFLKQLAIRIYHSDISGLSAQLAYYFLLSFFPLLITLITLLPYLPFSQNDVMNILKDFAPADTMVLIESNVDQIMDKQNTPLLSFGLISTIWIASNGVSSLMKAFHYSYRTPQTRSYVYEKFLSIVFTFVFLFVFILAMLLPVFGQQIGLYISQKLDTADSFQATWQTIRWAISPLILFILFLFVYKIIPNLVLKAKAVYPGAIFATIGWTLTSLGFSYYVNNFGNYSTTYGSIGAVIVLMTWLYFSGIIVMIGGEINALMAEKIKKV